MVGFQKLRGSRLHTELSEPFGEINTTPLVDVMLVLLIIFLITIPVINASVKVDLPDERFAEKVRSEDIATITVTNEENIFFNGTLLGDYGEYAGLLSNLLKTNKVKAVQIYGDSNVSFEKIELVISQLRDLGVETITLVTRP